MLWDDEQFKIYIQDICNRVWLPVVEDWYKMEYSIKKKLWFLSREQHDKWAHYVEGQLCIINKQHKAQQRCIIDSCFGREDLLKLEEQFLEEYLYSIEELRKMDNYYINLIKRKDSILSGFMFYCAPKLTIFNYALYLFYNQSWLTYIKGNTQLRMAISQYKTRFKKMRNYLYYSIKSRLDNKFKRSIVQLTPRYRNKFFTFFKKKLQFNLSVGRVFFWKLKRTVFGRILNFYNVFFRCIIPFLSKKFTFLLYKMFSGWSGDFQKFGVSIARARKRRKIRRKFSFFKIIILPKLIYGFMRTPKYPIRKRFLQRRSFIKYMCS